jgi:surface-anchored protein
MKLRAALIVTLVCIGCALPAAARAQIIPSAANLPVLQALLEKIQMLEAKLLLLDSLPIVDSAPTVSPPAVTAPPATVGTNTSANSRICFFANRSLSRGMTGQDVTRLQQLLALDPSIYAGSASGTFDATTERAVIAFQLKNGIITSEADGGTVGPKTYAFMQEGCPGMPATAHGTIWISSFSGPVALSPYQQGTWTVGASDSHNSTLSYSIMWGDGTQTSASVSASFAHAFTKAGTYTITVTARNTEGLETSASMRITVNAVPAAILVAYPASGTAPLGVQFSANNLPEGSAYVLDFGDGSLPAVTQYISSTSSPNSVPELNRYTLSTSHTYRTSGIYTAILRASTSTGTVLGTAVTTVASSSSTH